MALIATDAFPSLQNEILNYAKVRVGFGQSAGFTSPYRTRSLLSLNSTAFDPGSGVIQLNTTANTLGNAALQPELISELEVGIDTRLFNRINLNVSLFADHDQLDHHAYSTKFYWLEATVNAELSERG